MAIQYTIVTIVLYSYMVVVLFNVYVFVFGVESRTAPQPLSRESKSSGSTAAASARWKVMTAAPLLPLPWRLLKGQRCDWAWLGIKFLLGCGFWSMLFIFYSPSTGKWVRRKRQPSRGGEQKTLSPANGAPLDLLINEKPHVVAPLLCQATS